MKKQSGRGKYEDGTYEIRSGGQNETVIVGSVAYTGWKMIGVVPESVQAANYKNFRYYVFATILVLLVMLLEGNQLVSRKISKPIRELDASVKAHEAGGNRISISAAPRRSAIWDILYRSPMSRSKN